MKNLQIILLILFAGIGIVAGQTNSGNGNIKYPNFEIMENEICIDIASMKEAENPDEHGDIGGTAIEFRYQETVYRAAGINRSTDSDETKLKKIRALWKISQHRITCASLTFKGVVEGSVLKYAISKQFNSFIYLAINEWDFDLEASDHGLTVLEYIAKLKSGLEPSNPYYKKLSHYELEIKEKIAEKKTALENNIKPSQN